MTGSADGSAGVLDSAGRETSAGVEETSTAQENVQYHFTEDGPEDEEEEEEEMVVLDPEHVSCGPE